jgi:hypothetical protein
MTVRLRSWLVLLCAASGAAAAHTQEGSLGDPASSTDYYQVSCTDDGSGVPASMMAQVLHRDLATVTVATLIFRGTSAITTADAAGGDAQASPPVYVNGGDGVYNMFVQKTGAGSVNYTLTYHCMTGANGTGLHTGTTIVFRQNQ